MTNEERSKLKYEEIKLRVGSLKETSLTFMNLLPTRPEEESKKDISMMLKCYSTFAKELANLANNEPDYRKFYEVWLGDIGNLSIKLVTKEVPEKTQPQKTTQTGFQSNLNDTQIENLYAQMQGTYFDTTIDNFKAIFKNKSMPPDCSIAWLKTNVLLSYFIKKLFHADNFLNVWSIAESIFEKNNKPIKNLVKSECNNDFPKGHKDIDTILKNIYTPL